MEGKYFRTLQVTGKCEKCKLRKKGLVYFANLCDRKHYPKNTECGLFKRFLVKETSILICPRIALEKFKPKDQDLVRHLNL